MRQDRREALDGAIIRVARRGNEFLTAGPESAWTLADIEIALDADMTDDPVMTVRISTPVGVVTVMAEVALSGRELFLTRTHIQGENLTPGSPGRRH
jgi:hypothetical protein